MTLDKSNCDAIALDSIATGLFSFNQTFYVYLYPDADINLCSIENWLVFQIYAIESYTILNCCQTVKNNNISNKTMSCRIYCAASLSFQIQSILFWWVFFFHSIWSEEGEEEEKWISCVENYPRHTNLLRDDSVFDWMNLSIRNLKFYHEKCVYCFVFYSDFI